MVDNNNNTSVSENETKAIIINFIKTSFTEYSFERMLECNEDNGDHPLQFDNYSDFMDHNTECVNNLSNNDIVFMLMLIDKISDRDLLTTDEEDFGEWEADAIYFNEKKKLVIMHPR